MKEKIFNNTEKAFALKSDKELKDAVFVFRMMSRPWMVAVGTKLTKLALSLKLPVKGLIRKTIFNQFCGGETREECVPVIEKIYQNKVHTVFDYASEIREKGEAAFDRDLQNQLEIAGFAQDRREVPFIAIKPTNLGAFSIWEKVSSGIGLTEEEKAAWHHIKNRFETLTGKIDEIGLRIQVDAEESWTQKAVDILVEELMERYNKERVVIYNTVQCYRWDRLQYVKELHQRAKDKGFKVGIKMVRGAYMEKENLRAEKMGYPTPICKNKGETDLNYNNVLRYCLQHIDDISIYIGTHNEESSYLAMQLMDEAGIAGNDNRVWFSQLYGMSDHITFNLAQNGFNAAKYMPFGKVEEVIPYLIRRAEENTSVKGQTGRELALLLEEKKRRASVS